MQRFPQHLSENRDDESAQEREDVRRERLREDQVEQFIAEQNCPENHRKIKNGRCLTCGKRM
jgi:hypothetical protein